MEKLLLLKQNQTTKNWSSKSSFLEVLRTELPGVELNELLNEKGTLNSGSTVHVNWVKLKLPKSQNQAK